MPAISVTSLHFIYLIISRPTMVNVNHHMQSSFEVSPYKTTSYSCLNPIISEPYFKQFKPNISPCIHVLHLIINLYEHSAPLPTYVTNLFCASLTFKKIMKRRC